MKEKIGTITLAFYDKEFWEEINCQAKAKQREGKSLKAYIIGLISKDISNHPTAELKRMRIDREMPGEPTQPQIYKI